MTENQLNLVITPQMRPGGIQCLGDLMIYYKERVSPEKALPRVTIPIRLFERLKTAPDGALSKITTTELMLFEETPEDPASGPPLAVNAFFTLESDFPGGAFCQHFSENIAPSDVECRALLECFQQLSNACFELRQIWLGRRFRFVELDKAG